MKLQEALNLYRLGFMCSTPIESNGYTIFKVVPTTSQGTLNRLNTRLKDVSNYIGHDLEVITQNHEIFLRYKNGVISYDWVKYAGHIDFNDVDIPFMVGMAQGGIVMDTLNHCPHLLVAGTTGSGKSVFLHTLLNTTCCNPNIDTFIIDLKRVEFTQYERCAYIATEISGDHSANLVTARLCDEMENRYKLMRDMGIKDFHDLKKSNPETKRKLLVVDELSELLMNKEDRKRLIPRLLRIAQLGRAAGIHLVIATQRPDHTIIDGVLKANIPTRLAFHCISAWDSRIILDRSGAENLTGNGDGLYLKNGDKDPTHIQSFYIRHDEINNVPSR